MEGVLQEIDDGVIIVEYGDADDDQEDSFSTVEFANSFMQRLFGSGSKDNASESAETSKNVTKQPILSKTSEQTLDRDMDQLIPEETNSVRDLIIASKKQDTETQEKGFYFTTNQENLLENGDDEPENSSQRKLVKKKTRRDRSGSVKSIAENFFVVQASVKKLVFNEKLCCILILKNLTSAFKFKRASKEKENMEMLTTTVSHEMRLPLESSITMCKMLLSWVTDERFIELIKSIWSAN